MKFHQNIETVNQIDKKNFETNYLHLQKPLVIKGLANNYSAGKKWTIDYLKKECGDVKVEVFDNSIKNHTASAFTTPDFEMQFSDYVDIITKDKSSDLRMFLFNMFKRKPGLRNDFPCPDIFNGILGKIGFMFFGSKNIKVRIHQDIDMSNVLLTQFYGRKRVVLISPKYSALLYRLPFNTYSLVDLDNPDYTKYPGLAYIEASECILEPGDSLFMPSGYWHYITYMDGGFAVSYRKLAVSFKMKLLGLISLGIYMPFDKLMNILLGKRWLSKKEEMAEIRANKMIIRKLLKQHIPENVEHDSYFGSELHQGHHHNVLSI